VQFQFHVLLIDVVITDVVVMRLLSTA